MTNFINAMRDYSTTTENGAATHATTGSEVLNGFAHLGSMRKSTDAEIKSYLIKALDEDFSLGLRMGFYISDIREGQGERRVARILVNLLATNYYPIDSRYLMEAIAEYSRYDVITALFDTPYEPEMLSFVADQLIADLTSPKPSLLAKWLPSANRRSEKTRALGKRMAKGLHLTEKDYRKLLSELRARIGIVETLITEGRFDEIELNKVPGVALKRYTKVLNAHIPDKMTEFFDKAEEALARGITPTLKTKTLSIPELYFDTIHGKITPKEGNLLWRSLPDYLQGSKKLPVIDTSGSMSGWNGYSKDTASNIANSLGIYMAERLTGPFKDCYMSFSDDARLMQLPSGSLATKAEFFDDNSIIASTNLQSVFDLMLKVAVENHLSQDDLPTSLVIFSDMEFNEAVYMGAETRVTNFKVAKSKFEAKGYKLPQVVFWNVKARNVQFPVQAHQSGAILVSGSSPIALQMVLTDKEVTPYDLMLSTLNTERYDLAAKIK